MSRVSPIPQMQDVNRIYVRLRARMNFGPYSAIRDIDADDAALQGQVKRLLQEESERWRESLRRRKNQEGQKVPLSVVLL